MPRPNSAQILASQLEQAMAFYAAKDSSPPSSSGAASSSTQTLAPPSVSSSSQATDTVQPIRSGDRTTRGAKERDARSGSLSRLAPPAHSLARPPLALETARSVPHKDDGLLTEDDDDDELDEFGYGRRNRGPKKESLLDILNSEPPPWMNQPPLSSSFSLDPVDSDNPKSSSLTSKLRRRLRASTTTTTTTTTTTSGSHGDLVSRGGGGAVGLTTLRNSKSSTNLLLASLGRKARPSGGGRARANTGSSSKGSPKTRRASHEFDDPPSPSPPLPPPPPPPQMLPFDLPPLLIPPTIANITPARTVIAQTSKEKKKLARKPPPPPTTTTNDQTRHSHETGPLDHAKGRRDASTEEEILASVTAAGTSHAHDDIAASVQNRRDTFSTSRRGGPMSQPFESDQQLASSAASSDVTAASFEYDLPDRDRSSTRSASERRASNSSPRRPVPEPLRTRAPLAELSPLRADSDESIISYASIQKSPTRGPMPRRISRKPTSSPSGTLAARSSLETRPVADVRDAQIIDRAAEWTLSPTEDCASPFVENHHDSLPSSIEAHSHAAQPGATRTQTPSPPRERDSDQVRRRLQSLQDHISAFLRAADHSDGKAASVIEVEVLAARLAEAGTLLRRSLASVGDHAGSGSSEEPGNEPGY